MTPRDDGGFAFPIPVISQNQTTGETSIWQTEGGMTLRDYFAAKAMQGLLAQSQGSAPTSDIEFGATYAYQMADAMLKARAVE